MTTPTGPPPPSSLPFAAGGSTPAPKQSTAPTPNPKVVAGSQWPGSNAALTFSLISISFSHFCEKARWALDYYKVPYTDRRSLPVLHFVSTWAYRSKERPSSAGSTKNSTPILCVSSSVDNVQENVVQLNDSSDILDLLSARFAAPAPNTTSSTAAKDAPNNLYTNNAETREKIKALEARFGQIIGPCIRRYMYIEMFYHCPDKKIAKQLGQHDNAGSLQSWLWTTFFSVFRWILIKHMRISDSVEKQERNKDILRREFDHLSRVLESGPPGPAYLIGNEFTAADLTLSALAGLVVGISEQQGYSAWVPKSTEFRQEAQDFMAELKATTAGQHIWECYRLHRGRPVEGTKPAYGFSGRW